MDTLKDAMWYHHQPQFVNGEIVGFNVWVEPTSMVQFVEIPVNFKTKKILVKKCDDPQMWYAQKIGQEVVFLGEDTDEYISREDAGFINIVKKKDAEIITYGKA